MVEGLEEEGDALEEEEGTWVALSALVLTQLLALKGAKGRGRSDGFV